jgi:hypothetical protein
LIFAAWRLLAIKSKDSETRVVAPPPYHIAAVIGLVIGLLSGVVGVGGGIFLSPIILLFGWGDAKTTAGVAAAFVWLNSAAGLVGNAISGQLVLEAGVLLPFAIAVSIGGFFGSKMGAEGLSQQTIRRLLVAVLLLAALKRVVELIV